MSKQACFVHLITSACCDNLLREGTLFQLFVASVIRHAGLAGLNPFPSRRRGVGERGGGGVRGGGGGGEEERRLGLLVAVSSPRPMSTLLPAAALGSNLSRQVEFRAGVVCADCVVWVMWQCSQAEFRSCVRVEVAVLDSPSLIVRNMVSVDVKLR